MEERTIAHIDQSGENNKSQVRNFVDADAASGDRAPTASGDREQDSQNNSSSSSSETLEQIWRETQFVESFSTHKNQERSLQKAP